MVDIWRVPSKYNEIKRGTMVFCSHRRASALPPTELSDTVCDRIAAVPHLSTPMSIQVALSRDRYHPPSKPMSCFADLEAVTEQPESENVLSVRSRWIHCVRVDTYSVILTDVFIWTHSPFPHRPEEADSCYILRCPRSHLQGWRQSDCG